MIFDFQPFSFTPKKTTGKSKTALFKLPSKNIIFVIERILFYKTLDPKTSSQLLIPEKAYTLHKERKI